MKHFLTLFLLAVLVFFSCKPAEKAVQIIADKPENSWVELKILHVNDVYEIAPLAGGKIGGLSRVATIRKQLLKETPNVLTTLAGDFLNPSAIGTVKLNGKRVKGEQMVDVMNAVGFDFVVFGNHEFDLKEPELQARINESDFEWIAGNIRQNVDNSVEKFKTLKNGVKKELEDYRVYSFKADDGSTFRLGILATCLDFNQKDYVHYMDVYETAKTQFAELAAKSDAVIGVTHLNLDQDQELARQLPELKVIIGGHEHHLTEEVENGIPILKADANAKSAMVHTIRFNTSTKEFAHSHKVIQLDTNVKEDAEVAALVKEWEDKAYAQFLADGYDVKQIVYSADEPLDGREKVIRNGPTNLGKMIAQSMYSTTAGLDAAFVNSGSIRIDDKLEGEITQLDIIRCLPFGGGIMIVEMSGAVLQQTLEVGLSNKNSGGYLQWHNIEQKEGVFFIAGQKLDTARRYKVAVSDFLMTGQEKNLDFLTSDNPGIYSVKGPNPKTVLRSDIRKAFINYLSN